MNLKSVLKSVGCAVGTTVVSVIALTVTRGVPTKEQLVDVSLEMFAVAFVVFLFFVFNDNPKS